MKALQNSSIILFHKLEWSNDPEHKETYFVTRTDTNDTLQVGPQERAIIKKLYDQTSLENTAQQEHVEVKTVKSLILTMLDSGFLKQIDNVHIPDFSEKMKPSFKDVPSNKFTWILNRNAFLITLFIAITGCFIGLTSPAFTPNVEDFIWMDDIALVYIVNVIIQNILAFLHEFGHYATTRALGAHARFSISYRFLYIVFQTESYGLFKYPKKYRYYVYLSGICIDFAIIGLAYWFLILMQMYQIDIGIYALLIKAQILLQFASIFWQMNAYLETDIYNVLSELFDEPNLYNNTKKLFVNKLLSLHFPGSRYLRKTLRFFFNEQIIEKESDDLRSFSADQKKRLLLYTITVTFGLLATSIFFFTFIFYREILYIVQGVQTLYSSIQTQDFVGMIKAFIFITLICVQYIVLSILMVKENKTKIKKIFKLP